MPKKTKTIVTTPIATIIENVVENIVTTQEDIATMPKKSKTTTVQENNVTTATQENTATVPQETSIDIASNKKQKHNGILQSLQAFIVDPREVQTIAGINPRKNLDLADLKEYIRVNGTSSLPPIKLLSRDNVLFLTEGHRRLQATKELMSEGCPIKGLPAMWADKRDTDDARLLFNNLTSNQGKALEPMEVAEGIALLVSYKWTQADIAKKMGKTPAWINQVLSRLEASDKVKTALEQGQIPVTVLQSIVATGKKYGKENNVTDQHAKQDDALSVHLTGKLEKKEQGTIRTGKRGRPSGSASTANTGNNAKPSNASAQKPSNNPAPSTNNAPSNASNKKNASNAPSNGKKPSNNGTVKSAFENEKDPAFKHELIKTEQEIIRHRKNVGLANILLMLLNFENSTDADACHDYNAALRTCLGHINGIDKGKK